MRNYIDLPHNIRLTTKRRGIPYDSFIVGVPAEYFKIEEESNGFEKMQQILIDESRTLAAKTFGIIVRDMAYNISDKLHRKDFFHGMEIWHPRGQHVMLAFYDPTKRGFYADWWLENTKTPLDSVCLRIDCAEHVLLELAEKRAQKLKAA
jgi:hypothetical protein